MKRWFALMLAVVVAGCGDGEGGGSTDVHVVREAARDAYIYGYPIVLMERTRQVSTAVPRPEGSRAPLNQYAHIRTFPDPNFKDVVSPNVDTLYSIAWLDLAMEPLVVTVPDARAYATPDGEARYYLLQMLDAWTNVFDSPGLRTRGPEARAFLLTGPDWQGEAPAGLERIVSPTSMVWITGRTHVLDEADMPTVHAFQDQLQLIPLSKWPGSYQPPAEAPIEEGVDVSMPPPAQVDGLDAQQFFTELAMLMKKNPPAAYDGPMLEKLGILGLVAGQPFDLSSMPLAELIAIEEGYALGKAMLSTLVAHSGSTPINGWTVMTSGIGEYGDNYDARAVTAVVGLGANLPEDAVYPRTAIDGAGAAMTTANRYTLTFGPGQWPPSNAFWSLTLYDSDQAVVENPINRYALGDRSDLVPNADGSLTIYIQKDAMAGALVNNWLPAPQGENQAFNLIMRIYWPTQEMLDGTWVVPPVRRVAE